MTDEMILVEFQHSEQDARLNDGGESKNTDTRSRRFVKRRFVGVTSDPSREKRGVRSSQGSTAEFKTVGMHTMREAIRETMQIPLCSKVCLKEHRFLRTRVYSKHRSAIADT